MESQVVLIALLYFAVTIFVGFWVARGEKKKPEEYFLAGRKLPWYAVAMSMTGSNIGTEHFIGMVGTAYAWGLAPATFEWGNFLPYSILVWVFLPYFFRKKLYTIPEFLAKRKNDTTRALFALFILLHMVLAVLTPAIYAGGRMLYEMALKKQAGGIDPVFIGCILVISGATAAYCIYGGLLSVVWTDVLQVAILLLGGVFLVIVGSAKAGGIGEVIRANQEHLAGGFRRIGLLQPVSHPVSPWTGVATFWLTLSLWYVGTNQFYIQRCLGARSEWDARMGVVGCAYIKIFLPFIIVFPGMVAFALYGSGLPKDSVYVKMINDLLPSWGKGIMLAVLVAAIMSTVSSVLNSASTIWAMDIHKRFLKPKSSGEDLVKVGRWATLATILIGTIIAPFLLYWEKGIFIYIQDMAAVIAPPVAVVFLAGFLWRKAHGRAASLTLALGVASGIILMVLSIAWGKGGIDWLKPLLNRAALNFAFCLAIVIISTYLLKKGPEQGDEDAIWNLGKAKLPPEEKHLNRGLRNLFFWWIVMVACSGSLFIIFS